MQEHKDVHTSGDSICHIYATSAPPGYGGSATIFPSVLTTATAVQTQQLLSLQISFVNYLMNFTILYNPGEDMGKNFISKLSSMNCIRFVLTIQKILNRYVQETL